MLTPEENKFINYWKNNREKEKRTFRQLLIGLPMGLTFAVVILAIFSSGWYERANMVAYGSSSPYLFVVAVIVIAGFIAIFSKKFRWDQNEQHYLELLHKQNKAKEAAENPIDQSPAKQLK